MVWLTHGAERRYHTVFRFLRTLSGARYAPAMTLFVLTMINGPAYDRSRPRREQRGWDEHAAFMNGLLEEGFVVLGGPIGDGEAVMLVVEAADEEEVRGRLGPDPWAPMGVLKIGSVQPWTIWLDSRPWTPTTPGAPTVPGADTVPGGPTVPGDPTVPGGPTVPDGAASASRA